MILQTIGRKPLACRKREPLRLRVQFTGKPAALLSGGVCWFSCPWSITLWFIGWVIDLVGQRPGCAARFVFIPTLICPSLFPSSAPSLRCFLILFLGVLTRGVATRRFLAAWENVFVRIPVFRRIYTAVKKLCKLFSASSSAQRQVVMIKYLRSRSLHSQLSPWGARRRHLEDGRITTQLVNLLVPTTPESDIGILPHDLRPR